MSGIAVIYNRDGRPVDGSLLTRMTDVIAYRGPDGVGMWLDGPVGLGHQMLHTTPESLREKQPLLDETGSLCLVLDGRVDNRDELRAALSVRGARLRNDTDAELVLQAYECWGEDCPKRIIGDFAFAIWDGRKRQLFAARDCVGIKPFYYYMDTETFLCGSELRQIFEDASVKRRPNEGMIGEYLACAITDNEETLYRDIFRLPPAHYLIVRPDGFRMERYWDIDPDKQIRYRTDDEYAEQLLSLFKEAVRCRLRSCGRVGAELSGGVDSSSIVSMAQSLYNQGRAVDDGFETFSLVFPGLSCDESAYIQDVVQMWDLKSTSLAAELPESNAYLEELSQHSDFPEYPNGLISYPLMSLAQAKGFRVILTGAGADEWLTGSFFHYADLIRQLKFGALARQRHYDRQFGDAAGMPAIIFPSYPMLKLGLLPLVPDALRRAIRLVLRRNGIPSWIDPHFARRIRLVERIRNEGVTQRFSSYAQQDMYSVFTTGWLTQGNELGSRSEALFGLERRHPFMDRRVIEFAFALPEEQRWREDQPKYVLRRAMRNLLPESIRQRRTKADFSHIFVDALQALGGERWGDSLVIAQLGWLDRAQAREMYQQMIQQYSQLDMGYMSYVWKLWMIFSIDLWFRLNFLNAASSSRIAA